VTLLQLATERAALVLDLQVLGPRRAHPPLESLYPFRTPPDEPSSGAGRTPFGRRTNPLRAQNRLTACWAPQALSESPAGPSGAARALDAVLEALAAGGAGLVGFDFHHDLAMLRRSFPEAARLEALSRAVEVARSLAPACLRASLPRPPPSRVHAHTWKPPARPLLTPPSPPFLVLSGHTASLTPY